MGNELISRRKLNIQEESLKNISEKIWWYWSSKVNFWPNKNINKWRKQSIKRHEQINTNPGSRFLIWSGAAMLEYWSGSWAEFRAERRYYLFRRRKRVLETDSKIGRRKSKDAWVWIEIIVRKGKIIGGWA